MRYRPASPYSGNHPCTESRLCHPDQSVTQPGLRSETIPDWNKMPNRSLWGQQNPQEYLHKVTVQPAAGYLLYDPDGVLMCPSYCPMTGFPFGQHFDFTINTAYLKEEGPEKFSAASASDQRVLRAKNESFIRFSQAFPVYMLHVRGIKHDICPCRQPAGPYSLSGHFRQP